jgi:hypothetical protein
VEAYRLSFGTVEAEIRSAVGQLRSKIIPYLGKTRWRMLDGTRCTVVSAGSTLIIDKTRQREDLFRRGPLMGDPFITEL